MTAGPILTMLPPLGKKPPKGAHLVVQTMLRLSLEIYPLDELVSPDLVERALGHDLKGTAKPQGGRQ